VDTLRHSAVMGWDVCVMVFVDSWDKDKGEKTGGGGGENTRVRFQPGTAKDLPG
jgi:hypothetical protein